MILLAFGGNLPSPVGPPVATFAAVCGRFEGYRITLRRLSALYISTPQPTSDQPDFVNAVALVETALPPLDLLATLQRIEGEFGRLRGERWAARPLDLDLLAYDERIYVPAAPGELALPHPRLHLRRFVLRPLADVAPGWRHPVSGLPVERLLAALGEAQPLRPYRGMGAD
ncbi:MAG: 2-amino-4-hydroxy-6-hydroxymethyldihydropteridine diphosphokinase [Alphaproteobacteria bacterium]|nr:2-amino-4-hydroxy-6-hydroxymethyldihydropteridine diphosphokinase [Alphaproteobacteria bacterium]